MAGKDCKLTIESRRYEHKLAVRDRLSSNGTVNLGFDEETALAEARRCLGQNTCESCDLCVLVCPEMCVTRKTEADNIEIDYNICTGCGVCAFICPRGAIRMTPELAA